MTYLTRWRLQMAARSLERTAPGRGGSRADTAAITGRPQPDTLQNAIPPEMRQLPGEILAMPVPPPQEYDCGLPARLIVRWESLWLEAGPGQRGPPAHPSRASPE